MDFLMLVRKDRVKCSVSEDLEDIGYLGTGTKENYLFFIGVLALLERASIQDQQTKSIFIHNSPSDIIARSESCVHLKMQLVISLHPPIEEATEIQVNW